MKISDKLWLVTGGGSGMGRNLVLLLLDKGARVITVDINKEALKKTSVLAGSKVEFLTTLELDITNKDNVIKTVEEIIATNGPIDGLINNAGIIQPFKHLNELDVATVERIFNVNFWGMIYLAKTLLPHFMKRPEAHIVNVSSMGGFFAFPGQTAYGASKAAVKLITEGLMLELRETSINVSVVFPGAVNTNIMSNSGLREKGKSKASTRTESRALSAEKAAKIMVDGIEKNKKRIFVGKDSRIMDMIYRINPNWAMDFIANKTKHRL